MDEKWVRDVDLWKSQMELVIPRLEKDSAQHTVDIADLQTVNEVSKATEKERVREAVAIVQKSGSFRLQQIAIILVALVAIAGSFVSILKGDFDYHKLAEEIVKAGKP
jgi:acetolactate synthase small subunit